MLKVAPGSFTIARGEAFYISEVKAVKKHHYKVRYET